MENEEGCWNCKYDELGPDEEPCDVCDLFDLRFKRWERGDQVLILRGSKESTIDEN